jgi:hypothetical protein
MEFVLYAPNYKNSRRLEGGRVGGLERGRKEETDLFLCAEDYRHPAGGRNTPVVILQMRERRVMTLNLA